MAEDGDFFCAMGWGCMPVMDGPIFNRLQLGTAFYDEGTLYFPRLSHVSDRIVKRHILKFLVKSPAISSGIPQEGVDFPGLQFLGSTSRQKPSYRHPRARVPMLSMVEYSCTVQLFRTAVLCHVINRSVTSSDTSS